MVAFCCLVGHERWEKMREKMCVEEGFKSKNSFDLLNWPLLFLFYFIYFLINASTNDFFFFSFYLKKKEEEKRI